MTAAALAGMALLALVFTVAANAQQTTETAEPQVEQQTEEAQPSATDSSQAAPAEQAEAPAPIEGQIVEQPEGTHAASSIIGQSVYSAEGEEIGQISDLLIGEENRVIGVIIGVGGFLGIGQKPVAVELERLSRAATEESGEQLMLNFTRAELEQVPQFVTLDEQRERQAAEQARQQQEQDMTGADEPAVEEQTGAQTEAQ